MNKKYPYCYYVIGVIVAWTLVLIIVHAFISKERFQNAVIFGSGFILGVIVAGIAKRFFK